MKLIKKLLSIFKKQIIEKSESSSLAKKRLMANIKLRREEAIDFESKMNTQNIIHNLASRNIIKLKGLTPKEHLLAQRKLHHSKNMLPRSMNKNRSGSINTRAISS